MVHPHPHTTEKKISGIGYVDFGTNYKGYRTDLTVPFIKGDVDKKIRKAVKIVLQAYDIAVNSVQLGDFCWHVHKKVDDFLRKHKYKMKHALGHGIGLRTHELPYIGIPKRKRTKKWQKLKMIRFQKNMVFTLEPAIYTRNFGVRLENVFLLKSKLHQLTKATLIEVNC
jgi:Xaa-Pro dipeptidase